MERVELDADGITLVGDLRVPREAYARMGEPKRLVWLDAKLHIDLYDTEPYVTQAVEAVAAFLAEHL